MRVRHHTQKIAASRTQSMPPFPATNPRAPLLLPTSHPPTTTQHGELCTMLAKQTTATCGCWLAVQPHPGYPAAASTYHSEMLPVVPPGVQGAACGLAGRPQPQPLLHPETPRQCQAVHTRSSSDSRDIDNESVGRLHISTQLSPSRAGFVRCFWQVDP